MAIGEALAPQALGSPVVGIFNIEIIPWGDVFMEPDDPIRFEGEDYLRTELFLDPSRGIALYHLFCTISSHGNSLRAARLKLV
jgi:hypothetical protein